MRPSTYRTLVLSCALLTFSLGLGACGDPLADLDLAEWHGHVRLNAKDPFRHSWDFLRQNYGGVIQENEVKNGGQHIAYDSYYAGEFSVGIQGGEKGVIVDLGSDEELAKTLGVTQTVGGGQGFAHLSMETGRFGYAPADAALAWAPAAPGSLLDHLPVVQHHVYLLRIVDGTSGLDMVVKLLVVQHETDAVEFEWIRLR